MSEAQTDTGGLLVVSDGAAAKIAELLAEDGGTGRYLRVYVNGGGCSRFQSCGCGSSFSV